MNWTSSAALGALVTAAGALLLIGVDQRGVAERINALLPGYMAMGEGGMAEMQAMAGHVRGPRNTLPMMMGEDGRDTRTRAGTATARARWPGR